MNHFRDLLRQLIRIEARSRPDRAAILRDAATGNDVPPEHQELLSRIKHTNPDVWAAYRLVAAGVAGPDEEEHVSAYEQLHSNQDLKLSWGFLVEGLEKHMVRLGLNPAGPQPSRSRWHSEQWWRYFLPPDGCSWEPLEDSIQVEGRERIRKHLTVEIAQAVFDRAGRDLEAIGLGIVLPQVNTSALLGLTGAVSREVLSSAVRILGLAQQFEGSRRLPADVMPRQLRLYLKAIADRHVVSFRELAEELEHIFSSNGVINDRFQLATGRLGAPLSIRIIGNDVPISDILTS